MGLYSLTTWVTYCKIAVPANLITMYVAGLNLHSRDAIVAVPSQRRNSFSPLRPARQHRPRPQERLKSGNDINIVISIICYLLYIICYLLFVIIFELFVISMKAFTTWMTHTAPSGNRRQLRTEYQVGVTAVS